MNGIFHYINSAALRIAYARIRSFAFLHKFWSAVIVLCLLLGGWQVYAKVGNTSGIPQYALAQVATSTVVASVSESGQVSTTNSINIEPQVSGNVTWVGVKAGDAVRAGQALMTIDNTSALQTVTDAKRQLAADELQFQQNSAQAPISYQNDTTALSTDKENLQTDYNNVYNDITNAYLDLPDIMSGAQDIIYGYDLDPKKIQWNMDLLMGYFNSQQNTSAIMAFEAQAKSDYTTATADYTASLAAYQATTRDSSNGVVDSLLAQTITTMTDAAQNLQTELNFLNAVSNAAQTYNITLPAKFSTLQTNTRASLSTANTDLSTLLGDKTTLNNAKQTIISAAQTITLDQVGNPNGSNPISLQVLANTIAKEKEDLATQEADLANYTITAPFAGTISVVNAEVGNSATGVLASIVSQAQIAELSLNEVDAAKIKIGDKATLTFDAINGLTLTGTVAEIDPVGTVSQGVVSYDVKVSFDAQNSQIKPGMTVNAAIETGVAENALVVPSSAVKTLPDGTSYVLGFIPALKTAGAASSQSVATTQIPQEIPVTTGLSDTANVQILSGLSAGQQIIARAVSAGSVIPAAAAARGGGFRPGGGAVLRGL